MKVHFDIECGGLTENLTSFFSKNRRFIRRLLQRHVEEGKTGFILRDNHNVAMLRDIGKDSLQ
jgi:hypothetical protein